MTENITVNTQSSIRIASTTAMIYIDPFRISADAHDADLILVTHDHYDHFSPDDINKIIKPDTVIAAPKSMEKQLIGAGITNTVLLAAGDRTTLCGADIETVPAYNVLKPFHRKSAGGLGYIVTVDGTRIYVAGDTDATDEAKAVRCDIALVPVGGTYTMDYKAAAALINTIRPKTAVPTHYGSIVGDRKDGESFKKLVDKDIETVLVL